ncbi:MAG: helix-turn-helix transcriptional regulator [Clostridia bacterium]|nr:helix-turn-helix transcriptional regulator [Clostridia bacterium]
MDSYVLQKQIMFSKNIECCREVIFDLRYLDITAYTGLAESTMISYDTRAVSPYITVAKKIADMYCTDIERLCGDEIYFDIEEVLELQVSFIKRLGGIEIKPYKEKILVEIDKHLTLWKYEVYELLSKIFRELISDLHRRGKYIRIEKDEQIIENFTKNFHNLHTFVKINYRKLGKAIDMSIGNLTRLEKGNEPMLSAVIKLADFFDVSITQMLSENPNFNYEKIQKGIDNKKSIANLAPAISNKKIKKDRNLRIDLLDKEQVKKLIIKWLNKIDM